MNMYTTFLYKRVVYCLLGELQCFTTILFNLLFQLLGFPEAKDAIRETSLPCVSQRKQTSKNFKRKIPSLILIQGRRREGVRKAWSGQGQARDPPGQEGGGGTTLGAT